MGRQGPKCVFSHFPTRSPRTHGPTDQPTDGPTDGQSLFKSCMSATEKKIAKYFVEIMNSGWCHSYCSFLIHISSFMTQHSSIIIFSYCGTSLQNLSFTKWLISKKHLLCFFNYHQIRKTNKRATITRFEELLKLF